jgi:hypothetical protein
MLIKVIKESQEENLPESNENKALGKLKLKYGYEKSEKPRSNDIFRILFVIIVMTSDT